MANKTNLSHLYVILCGGTGPRLWPLSTTSHPKQFLSILSTDNLLVQTIKRTLKITDRENIFITTSNRNLDQIKQSTKNLIPPNNVIIEPDKKNTAMAIFYTLDQLKELPKDTVVTFLPSDHFIAKTDKFKNDLTKAANMARENSTLVTIGIHPSFPNTSFGYILKNNRFIEKPNKIAALKYIIDGALWNSGIYTGTINTYLSEFEKYFPKPNYDKCLPLAFDKAITEKTKKMQHIKASFDWSDVGEWGSIFKKSPQDSQHIALVNPLTKYVSHNTHHCLVSSDNQHKLIGLVGVSNLAIIDTPNALLVTSLDQSNQVRDLVIKIVTNPKLKPFFADDE